MRMFEPIMANSETYTELSGTSWRLSELPEEPRADLEVLFQYFNWNPPYPQFKTYWRDDSSPVAIWSDHQSPHAGMIRAIGRDLERRLGLAQGRIAGDG